MRFMVTVPNSDDPERMALAMREVLRGVVGLNRYLMSVQRVPPLEDSGVMFAPEPFERNLEYDELLDCITAEKRGLADCATLVCWRVAELQQDGEPADVLIYWRASQRRGGHDVRTMHAQVRRADGSREDPSRLLGMVGSNSD